MGKKKEREKLLYKEFRQKYEIESMERLIERLPVDVLLKVGKRVCSSDYVVRFYYNENHPKFHKNQSALRHALRRAWAMGAFNHREQMMNVIEMEVEVETFKLIC